VSEADGQRGPRDLVGYWTVPIVGASSSTPTVLFWLGSIHEVTVTVSYAQTIPPGPMKPLLGVCCRPSAGRSPNALPFPLSGTGVDASVGTLCSPPLDVPAESTPSLRGRIAWAAANG
jgi:hypothetical protein